MTTTTAPDVDLAAWFAGSDERPCEVPVDWKKHDQCPHPADWLMAFRTGCPCGRPVEQFLTCDAHHELFTRAGAVCMDCDKPAAITWTERVRS